MSGKARGCPREGESSVQPYECKNMEEACDSAWLLWEATMLAAALDAYRNTNLRRLAVTHRIEQGTRVCPS